MRKVEVGFNTRMHSLNDDDYFDVFIGDEHCIGLIYEGYLYIISNISSMNGNSTGVLHYKRETKDLTYRNSWAYGYGREQTLGSVLRKYDDEGGYFLFIDI